MNSICFGARSRLRQRDGRFRGRFSDDTDPDFSQLGRISNGDWVVFNGTADLSGYSVDSDLTLDPNAYDYTLSWDGSQWVIVDQDSSGSALPIEVSTTDISEPLANTDGAGVGAWDKPPNRPATSAEITDVNASERALSAAALRQLITNRADSSSSLDGMANFDGSLGHYSRQASNVGFFVEDGDTVLSDINGATIGFGPIADNNKTVPSGRYPGQILYIVPSGAGFEAVLNGTFNGILRDSQHRIVSLDNSPLAGPIIIRPGENMQLIWTGSRWRVYSQFLTLSGPGWRENTDGTVTMWGSNVAGTVNLPRVLTNVDYRVTFERSRRSGSKTTTQFQTSGGTAAADWHLEGGLLDYAALGGIGSF